MTAKLTKGRNTSIRLTISFYLQSNECYGEHAKTFKSYMTLVETK